jgi:hypothetical protein
VNVTIDGKIYVTKPRNPDLKNALAAIGFDIDMTDPARPVLQQINTTGGTPHVTLEVLMAGANKDDCDAIWHNIEDHSRYSFNNAHAAAYGMCGSYDTAYLKGNYPVLYMTNLINSEAGVGSKDDGYNYKVSEYVEEARSMKLGMLPPCVKQSASMCKVVVRVTSGDRSRRPGHHSRHESYQVEIFAKKHGEVQVGAQCLHVVKPTFLVKPPFQRNRFPVSCPNHQDDRYSLLSPGRPQTQYKHPYHCFVAMSDVRRTQRVRRRLW